MSYEDEVWKRAEEMAGKDWDDNGVIAVTWRADAIIGDGTDRAGELARDVYYTALACNSVAAEIDALRDLFIEEKSELFYGDAEAELREEAQEAADSQREDEWAARMAELREVNLRG